MFETVKQDTDINSNLQSRYSEHTHTDKITLYARAYIHTVPADTHTQCGEWSPVSAQMDVL